MKHYLLLIIIFLAPVAEAQDKPVRIGEVEFFGYAGMDLDKIRGALPFHAGDEISREKWEQMQELAPQAVKQVTGNAPTEVSALCCDDAGNLIIFIGLSGRPVRYLPKPKGTARLPANVISLYEEFLKAVEEATRRGAAAEEYSNGYALAEYPPLRAIQLRMRAYAVGHAPLLRDVLANSVDEKQRVAASELLGYARKSRSQITALVRANRDSNAGVRNNATRALGVLVKSDPQLSRQIAPDSFIEMLLSSTWTDMNKASFVLSELTKGREPKLLAQLRKPEVLERLVEMARWRTNHANVARAMLGRIAGIEETRLQQLIASGQVDVILAALDGAR